MREEVDGTRGETEGGTVRERGKPRVAVPNTLYGTRKCRPLAINQYSSVAGARAHGAPKGPLAQRLNCWQPYIGGTPPPTTPKQPPPPIFDRSRAAHRTNHACANVAGAPRRVRLSSNAARVPTPPFAAGRPGDPHLGQWKPNRGPRRGWGRAVVTFVALLPLSPFSYSLLRIGSGME